MRSHRGLPWLALLPVLVWPSLAVSFAVHRLMQDNTLIGAVVMFSFATGTLRLLATWLISDPVTAPQMVAYALSTSAVLVKLLWRT